MRDCRESPTRPIGALTRGCSSHQRTVRLGGSNVDVRVSRSASVPSHTRSRFRADPLRVDCGGGLGRYSVFSNCASMVTVSPSGPRKLFKGVTTATSGVLARFPWLLPVRNPVAGYGASAVTEDQWRSRGRSCLDACAGACFEACSAKQLRARARSVQGQPAACV